MPRSISLLTGRSQLRLALAAVAGLLTVGAVAGLLLVPRTNSTAAPETGPPPAQPSRTPSQPPRPADSTPRADSTRPADSTPSAQPARRAEPPLTTTGLSYAVRSWGDPKTELGVIVPIPSTWTTTRLSTFESRFTSPNGLWTLRVNGVIGTPQPRAAVVTKKLGELRAAPDFRLLSRTEGSVKAANPVFAGSTFHQTTLTYTHTDPARGTRLVVNRFVTIDDATSTAFEVAAAGRPQDLPALQAITDKVTTGYARVP
ncbi:hypothetical protein ACQPXM_40170 [Kribbella sp. CA-253562]|uniref:hypothetical protein n=1 Tax=Kribbella sp. CA-253562 TaxID=3239942 RepID=UPI003D94178A